MAPKNCTLKLMTVQRKSTWVNVLQLRGQSHLLLVVWLPMRKANKRRKVIANQLRFSVMSKVQLSSKHQDMHERARMQHQKALLETISAWAEFNEGYTTQTWCSYESSRQVSTVHIDPLFQVTGSHSRAWQVDQLPAKCLVPDMLSFKNI